MEENKKTIMEIKVDLGCEDCRKKIKKVLCAIPEIQNQEYNENTSTVKITAFSSSPENVMKKISSKGGKTVKSIVIAVPEKPKEKPKDKPKEEEKPKQPKPEEQKKPQTPPVEPAPPIQVAIFPGYPPPVVPPNICCRECYEGHHYGPCYYGRPVPCYCGRPVPCHHERPVPLYDGYGRLVIYDSWGQNSQGCVIM